MTEANGSTQKCANVSGITTGAAENCVCVYVYVCVCVCVCAHNLRLSCVPHIVLLQSYVASRLYCDRESAHTRACMYARVYRMCVYM